MAAGATGFVDGLYTITSNRIYYLSKKKAKTYLFLYGPSPIANEAWFHAVNSLPYFTVTGLIPGNTYSFKIGVTGSKGQVLYTNVISQMVI